MQRCLPNAGAALNIDQPSLLQRSRAGIFRYVGNFRRWSRISSLLFADPQLTAPARRLLLEDVVECAVMQPSGTMNQSVQRARLANADDRALLLRIRAEFTESPGLLLTLAQASRLFNVEVGRCERILMSLVDRGQLANRGKRFART
jgi:hypothetical protein